MSQRAMTYGDSQAVKVLAAERFGLNPPCVEIAHDQLNGKPIHPMTFVRLSAAATDMHNQIASDESMVARANKVVNEIMAEHGFIQAVHKVSDLQLAQHCKYTTVEDGAMLRALCAKHGWAYTSDIPENVVNYVAPFLLDAS